MRKNRSGRLRGRLTWGIFRRRKVPIAYWIKGHSSQWTQWAMDGGHDRYLSVAWLSAYPCASKVDIVRSRMKGRGLGGRGQHPPSCHFATQRISKSNYTEVECPEPPLNTLSVSIIPTIVPSRIKNHHVVRTIQSGGRLCGSPGSVVFFASTAHINSLRRDFRTLLHIDLFACRCACEQSTDLLPQRRMW